MNIVITPTGTRFGYEDYHNDITINDIKVGTSEYDKNQDLQIAVITFQGNKKRFYRETTQGISTAIEKWVYRIQKEKESQRLANEEDNGIEQAREEGRL